MKKKLLDLDSPDNKDLICVVEYGGVKIPLTRERVIELLTNEQEWLTTSTLGYQPFDGDQVSDDDEPVLSPIEGAISHGSLSYRVKLIYKYSLSSKRLREAQISLLRELFAAFNWKIPRHPNTTLDAQLIEMQGWKKVPGDFKREIEIFLARYRQARQKAEALTS